MANFNPQIAIIGLGYVGLPVAVAFASQNRVIGFDINCSRINALKNGEDWTGEVESSELKNPNLELTSQEEDLKKANFYIVAVPTPIDDAHKPNLEILKSASQIVARQLNPGDIVVFESTVFPGATEDFCAPWIIEASGLKREDFKLAYSPERINPGDREHTFTKIKKVVSGEDEKTLKIVADVYSSVVTAGVFEASSIKVAEAAKVIENTQRDLNISLMNELSVIFEKMDISTAHVLEAAGTKWNFLPFRPGLVGGHCIGVDPYYLTYQAERMGYIPQVILAGRKINDSMGSFIAQKCIKMMLKSKINVAQARVGILGLTFKENCPDLRNSKVFDIVDELLEYGVEVEIFDPWVEKDELDRYSTYFKPLEQMKNFEALIVAVSHREFYRYEEEGFGNLLAPNGVLIDVKGVYQKSRDQYLTWSL